MASVFKLEIVAPDKKFYDDEAEMVIVRTKEGDVGILKDHVDYVAPVDIGVVKIKKGGNFKEAAIAGGFVKVGKEKVTILTDAAEWPVDIDLDRAEQAKKAAEEELKTGPKDETYVLFAETKLKRALNRIKVAEKKD